MLIGGIEEMEIVVGTQRSLAQAHCAENEHQQAQANQNSFWLHFNLPPLRQDIFFKLF